MSPPTATSRRVATIRIFRARRGEAPADARQRRAEFVALDTDSLLRLIARSLTPLDEAEVGALKEVVGRIPLGAAADVFLAPGGRVSIESRPA
jgi:hypothetical protein